MKKLIITFSALFISAFVFTQVPTGYYLATDGKTGYELKTSLHTIIKGHNSRGYSALWGFISSNDIDTYYENDGTILDIYSENPTSADPYNFTKVSDQCGNYSGEGSCYNREHSFPKSWFGGSIDPMYSDVHHLFATDGKVNSIRSNYPYGNVSSASQTSQNGSKLGSSAAGYSGTVFEPIDEFKGDVARAYFYMATRYEDVISTWQTNTSESNDVLDGSSDKVFEDWMLNVLLEWHTNDPVSQKEIDRNNAAYTYQGNRNPYIDHPEFVNCIWGGDCSSVPSDTTLPGDTVQSDTVSTSCKDILFPTSEDKPMWSEQLVVTKDNGASVSTYNNIYGLFADTTISGQYYSKLYRINSNIYSSVGGQYLGGIRSDSCGYVYYLSADGVEQLLYDFSKDVGDTVFIGHDKKKYIVNSEADFSFEDGSIGKTLEVVEQESKDNWVSGMGNLNGLLAHITVYPTDESYESRLLCFVRNNQLIYKGTEETCFPENTSTLSSTVDANAVVYPQPFSQILHISFNFNIEGELIVYSLTGQKLVMRKINAAQTDVDLKQLPAGTFLLFIQDRNGAVVHSQPIIKE